MTEARKMVDLDVNETSGVDHPAHLNEGWVVIKAAAPAPAPAAVDQTTEEQPVTDTAPEIEKAAAAPEAPAASCPTCVAKAASEEPSIEVLKAAMPEPLRAYLETVEKAATEAAEREAEALAKAAAEEDARLDGEAVAKAAAFKDLGLEPEQFGPILRKFAAVSPEGAEAVEKALAAALNQGETAALFEEVGKSAADADGSDAEAALDTLAKAAVAAGTASSYAAALTEVALQNPALAARYYAEKG